MSSPTCFSVSEITRAIKDCLQQNFETIRVKGEISDFTHYQASGHMYFSLADDESTLQSVMFRRINSKLTFDPEEGMTVIAEGRLDVYEKRGNYQLIVEHLEPQGSGDLEKEFQELKNKLEQEGALNDARKQPLPTFPTTIGVVTSGDGAAFWDIVRTIRRRFPPVEIILYPVRVNGRDSGPDIAHGIQRLPDISNLDCLIVGRGGGSPEDLWGFNTEEVARAILDCPIPVISAVGHEVDVTISDLVADHRSPTPTAAGEEVSPSYDELHNQLEELRRRIQSQFQNFLDQKRNTLHFLAEKPIFADPENIIAPWRNRFDRIKENFKIHFQYLVSNKKRKLEESKTNLKSLGPQNVLERGYTVISRNGKLITSISNVELDDTLEVQWKDGKAKVDVIELLQQSSDDSS